MKYQIPAVKLAVQRNAWYLGEASKGYVSEEMAMEDFLENHLVPYWAEIFKALFCHFKCDYGQDCSLARNNVSLANMFRGEVYLGNIDDILSGGDETEKIFKKFKEISDNS